jgi:hypothetical protein
MKRGCQKRIQRTKLLKPGYKVTGWSNKVQIEKKKITPKNIYKKNRKKEPRGSPVF